MTEKELWERLRYGVGDESHLTRIENAVSFGTPDVNMGYYGRDYWFELKREVNGYSTIRPTQVAWIIKRMKLGGGNVYFMTIDAEENISVYHGDIIRSHLSVHLGKPRIEFCTAEKLIYMQKPYDWKNFLKQLIRI